MELVQKVLGLNSKLFGFKKISKSPDHQQLSLSAKLNNYICVMCEQKKNNMKDGSVTIRIAFGAAKEKKGYK